MTLAELQRALTSVEPAGVLVPPRVMENIIRQTLQISGLTWTTPHQDSWIVDRTLLFRHVDQGDLALTPDQILPATVILIRWPGDDELQRRPRPEVLSRIWRQLYHASIHQAMERAWEDAVLTPAKLREQIELLGPTAFEEIQNVLIEENILSEGVTERAVFNEFAAVFLELHAFAPALLPTFFPGLSELDAVKTRFGAMVGADRILTRTRLFGAPEPGNGREARPSEANEFFHELEVSSDRATNRGNIVLAAIELQRATRVAPGDKAPRTRERAETCLAQLLDRFCKALELPEEERAGWKRLLPILLEKADQGSRPAEASLLYELQKVCVDHEREIYKLDIGDWLLNAGRRPLQRPLPSQRLVRITRTLRAAMPSLTSARLSDQDRTELDSLLQKALHRSEDRVRTRFRPILTNALQDVGLAPKQPLETTAFRKMVEELLDRIIAFGFVSFSDLRDTISRNQLKLADLSDAQDFIRGDPLIRLDRRLSTALDGVYRPGEFYLRWLERFTSLNFGTKLGRVLTRFVTLPIGGGFLILETMLLLMHLLHRLFGDFVEPEGVAGAVGASASAAPHAPVLGATTIIAESLKVPSLPASIYYGLFALFSVIVFGLLHSVALRDRIVNAVAAVGRGLRRWLFDAPLGLVHRYGLDKFFTSWGFQLFYWYIVKPLLMTLLLAYLVPQIRHGYLEIALAFFTCNFVINTRPGEAFWHTLIGAMQSVFDQLRKGLIPGIFRAVVRFFKQILHWIESFMFMVDEWLRFRGGESQTQVALRSVVTLLWLPISYLIRFNLVVFIEPCLHPLKLPVCSVAAKFVYPMVPLFRPTLIAWGHPVLGNLVTEIVVWWVIFWLPDVFGFVFWEMKENWTLFRSNKSKNVGSVPVGPHAETVRRLFQPGFHSGTLPRLFAKIRHAEQKALASGNFSAVRLYRANQQEIEESLAKFLTREFCVLLEQSPAWKSQPLSVAKVELSSNRIRCLFSHPKFAAEPLTLSVDYREGWVVASLTPPAWLDQLEPAARSSMRNAFVLLYKLADVDLVGQQIRALLGSPRDGFDFTPDGLIVWPAENTGPLHVHLRPRRDSDELPEPTSKHTVVVWDPTAALFSQRKLSREDCNRSWPDGATNAPAKLLSDVAVLPSETSQL